MSGECFADGNRESAVLRISCFGWTLFTFFAATLATGVLVVLVLSGSACTWNPHVRCFSIARDTLGVISSAAEMCFMLALAVAFFAAAIAQVFRALTWWSALFVVPVSILAVGMLPIGPASLAREVIFDPPTFLAVGLVLFVGYQFSLLIGKLVGRLRP